MRVRGFLVLCVLGLSAGAATAQPRVGPTPRPPVSPYLNLIRPGNSPGVNYYGLVRPQIEFRNNLQNLQQQVTTNRDAITGLNTTVSAAIPVTGHATTYLNTGGYFSGGAGRAGASAPRAGAQQQARPQPPRR